MLKSRKARLDAPEMDSLRLGSGWKTEELDLPQIFVAGPYGEGSPGRCSFGNGSGRCLQSDSGKRRARRKVLCQRSLWTERFKVQTA